LLVLEDALLVLSIDRGGWWSVEGSSVLLSKLSVLSLLSIELGFTVSDDLIVKRLHLLSSLDGLGEVLSGTLLLEGLNLGPDGIWHIRASSDGVETLWKSVLLEEVGHLLVELLDLGELLLDELLDLVLKLVLHGSDLWRDELSELGIDLAWFVDLILAGVEGDKVLWVWLWQVSDSQLGLVVDGLVLVLSLGEELTGSLQFVIKV